MILRNRRVGDKPVKSDNTSAEMVCLTSCHQLCSSVLVVNADLKKTRGKKWSRVENLSSKPINISIHCGMRLRRKRFNLLD